LKGKCNICNKHFRNRVNYQKHLMQHKMKQKACSANNASTKRKSIFQCNKCVRFFSDILHLQKHQKVHSMTTANDSTCHICHQTFRTSWNMRRHMGLVHEKIKTNKLTVKTESSNESEFNN
jgi:hypothetical protein